jgi:prepilin-type N-terminal cleavage/methylation domain-containing protein
MLRRRGSTLLETLVALTVFGIVASAGLATLRSAVRATERTVLTGDQAAQLNGTVQTTSAVLQTLSPSDGDIIAASDTSLRVWATVLSGVVWDQGPTASPQDDRWTRHRLVSVSSPVGGCVGGPLADPVADASVSAWRLALSPPVDTLRVGAPLHLLRPQRLALYRSGGDWSLGHAEQTPTLPWSTIQPVTGPLQSPTALQPGLRFTLTDSTGSTATTSAWRVTIAAAAPLRDSLRSSGGRALPVASTSRALALRNAR